MILTPLFFAVLLACPQPPTNGNYEVPPEFIVPSMVGHPRLQNGGFQLPSGFKFVEPQPAPVQKKPKFPGVCGNGTPRQSLDLPSKPCKPLWKWKTSNFRLGGLGDFAPAFIF